MKALPNTIAVTTKFVLGLILLFSSINAMGQVDIEEDSLLRVYESLPQDTTMVIHLNKLCSFYMYKDPEKAKAYAKEQIRLGETLNHEKGVAQGYYDLGIYFNNRNQIDSTKTNYLKALQIYRKLNILDGEAMVNYGLAILEYAQGNYSKAIEMYNQNIDIYSKKNDSLRLGITYESKSRAYVQKGSYRIALTESLKGLKIMEKLNNPIRLADALNNLAGIEGVNENFDKSIAYNLQALKIYENENDRMYQAQALNDIGNSYFYLKSYDQAEAYLQRSAVLAQEIQNLDLEATALNNLGKTFTAKGLFNKALEIEYRSLEIVEGVNSKIKEVESLNAIGQTYSAMGNPGKAITYFSRAIDLADSLQVLSFLGNAYKFRALARVEVNDYQNAFEDLNLHLIFKDSVFNITKSQQIEEMRAIFDTEKKEQQIAQQETEIALLEEQEKVSVLQKWLLGSGLGLSLLVFGFGYYGIRQKMKRNALEREKVDAELAFKKKELTTQALHLARKNETLENLKLKAQECKKEASTNGYQQLITTINFDLQDDSNWENFSRYFEEVHKDFNANVNKKCPDVTPGELRLMALLKMNLSSKEIANILNISIPGIKKARQRLRKKLNLSSSDSLEKAILNI